MYSSMCHDMWARRSLPEVTAPIPDELPYWDLVKPLPYWDLISPSPMRGEGWCTVIPL